MVESPSLCRLKSSGQCRNVEVLFILHTALTDAESDFGHNAGANPIGAYLNEEEISFTRPIVSRCL